MTHSNATNGVPDLISLHRDQIAQLCRMFHVARLEVFGSAVTGEFDEQRSDIDLLMEFVPGYDPNLKLDAYLEFKARLEALFGRHVDLVFFSAVRNPYVRDEIEQQRTLLYAA
jgi:uncharacterized protein